MAFPTLRRVLRAVDTLINVTWLAISIWIFAIGPLTRDTEIKGFITFVAMWGLALSALLHPQGWVIEPIDVVVSIFTVRTPVIWTCDTILYTAFLAYFVTRGQVVGVVTVRTDKVIDTLIGTSIAPRNLFSTILCKYPKKS